MEGPAEKLYTLFIILSSGKQFVVTFVYLYTKEELINYYITFCFACQVFLRNFFVVFLSLYFGLTFVEKYAIMKSEVNFDFEGRMKLKKQSAWNQIRNVLLAVVGTLILAFGSAVFLLPFDLVAGGMSGMAIVIDAITPWEFLTVDLIITILTWSLFLVGFFVFGKDFAAKTLISAIVYPIGTTLFLKLTEPDVLGGLFCLTQSQYTELPIVLSAMVGGALVGAGCAITFLSGGSTGGTDIIAFILCKIFKRLKSSKAIFLTDVTIVLLGVFLTQDLVVSLLGILSAMIIAFVVDKIFLGGSAAFVAQIVTDHAEAVNRAIIEDAGRTSTILEATGGYSGKDKKLLTVTFSMRYYTHLMDIIHREDPAAFVTVWRAHEIRGEGWTWNKE